MLLSSDVGKTLQSPLTARRSNQSECSLEGLMLKLKLKYFGHLMQRADSFENDAGKDWRLEEKGTAEDEMIGWHYQLNGQEFEQTPGGGEGQASPVCCIPWGCQESNSTERLNNNNNKFTKTMCFYFNAQITDSLFLPLSFSYGSYTEILRKQKIRKYENTNWISPVYLWDI